MPITLVMTVGTEVTGQPVGILAYLFILVGGYSYEDSLLEGKCVEGVPAHGEDIVGLYYVNTGLVLVHGVEDNLQ